MSECTKGKSGIVFPKEVGKEEEKRMKNDLWKVIPERSSEYYLEIEDPQGWRSAGVKWDGCVHYNRYFNTPKGMDKESDSNADYLHICQIDEEIARLQALKRIACNYFALHGCAGHEWKSDLVVDGAIVNPLQLPEPE